MNDTNRKKPRRTYLFVVGGVMSGVGKGIASSAIGTILKARGFSVTALKIDPYINVDAGTMNPTEHGEVFVLSDGDETDQDMGNYERFLDINLTHTNYMTTGRVYLSVIERERRLEYGGRNVEVVPDIPLEVINRIETAAEAADADITLVEVGGTIGEYQNIIFLEAARMLKRRHPGDVAIAMVSYLPIPSKVGEMKTKPTQYAARTLNSTGLQADIIIARSDVAIDEKRRDKIATFCDVLPENIISAPDIDSIYDVPVNFEEAGLSDTICRLLKLEAPHASDLTEWKKFVAASKTEGEKIKIGIVGKYFNSGEFVLSDVYLSVIEGLKFSAYQLGLTPELVYLSAQSFENGEAELSSLDEYDGIVVPGGFGSTGIEGKLKVIQYVREHKIPYIGLCYGMQLMLIEFARNVLGWSDAHTTEINPDTKHPVVHVMESQADKVAESNLGGTMRLGNYKAMLKPGTHAAKAYGQAEVEERHRHRYEVNQDYIAEYEKAGVVFSGVSPSGQLMEISELSAELHPFMLGTQFHPELTARPLSPQPLFTAFLKAAKAKRS